MRDEYSVEEAGLSKVASRCTFKTYSYQQTKPLKRLREALFNLLRYLLGYLAREDVDTV